MLWFASRHNTAATAGQAGTRGAAQEMVAACNVLEGKVQAAVKFAGCCCLAYTREPEEPVCAAALHCGRPWAWCCAQLALAVDA